jgi:glycosyltransferase involved in cell wall biosynthesis
MKIAIIGTRGIPNHYGGFEQFAEFLSKELSERGNDLIVYSCHNHPYQQRTWNKVNIVHKFDPEYLIGTIGQFIYDFNCIIDTRKRNLDIILQLGYTSSSIWSFLFPKGPIIVTNMDGLEWKRTKYKRPVKRFLKYAEYLGVVKSNLLVADSPAIKDYLKKEYNADSVFVPYGAFLFDNPNEAILNKYYLTSYQYDMLIARIEPENNIEVILEGVQKSHTNRKFIVIGKTSTPFGAYIANKFSKSDSILFLGAIYDLEELNNLRHFSNLYFHGHSVGGTNPSLLEAMASSSLICAHKNVFNSSILELDAYFFETSDEVAHALETVKKTGDENGKISNNRKKIVDLYNWNSVIDQYEKLFLSTMRAKNNTQANGIC